MKYRIMRKSTRKKAVCENYPWCCFQLAEKNCHSARIKLNGTYLRRSLPSTATTAGLQQMQQGLCWRPEVCDSHAHAYMYSRSTIMQLPCVYSRCYRLSPAGRKAANSLAAQN